MASSRRGGKKTGEEIPLRARMMAYLAEHGGTADKRSLAKALGIVGSERAALKALLKELAAEGIVEKRARGVRQAGVLPPTAILEISGRDRDGELVASLTEWDGEAPRIVVLVPRRRHDLPAPGPGDRVLAHLERDATGEGYTARIVRLLARRAATRLGVVRVGPDGARVEPVDRKDRELAIDPTRLGGAKDGDLVSLSVSTGGRYGRERAEVVEVIGSLASEKAVSLIAIHAHGIPHVFPADVLEEAERARPVGLQQREDWRDLPLLTIDPYDAKDHDDAVHAAPDPANPGGHIVTVAIADVAWYVRPGSALDREAVKRGNSVYFPDRVVPMLPERISNDLCSLRAGEDRPALAVRMTFSADGRKTGHRFHRVLMRSAARLSYEDAQAVFDNRDSAAASSVTEPLAALWAAYGTLARGRDERQPLALDLPERKIVVNAKGGVERIVIPQRLEAHRLIEEFMIQANVAAAETLEGARASLIYRIHDAPSLAKLEALRDFLASLDRSFPKGGNLRPSHFNRLLADVGPTEHGAMIHEVVLRTQAQAEYSPLNIGHFGLNLRRYAHFTSPIRRYADLIVHRALVTALRLGAGGMPEGEVDFAAIAAQISEAERRAVQAERDTVDRLIAHWLADRVGAEFAGRISGVTRAGLFVKLDETGADGFVPMSTLGEERFRHEPGRHAIVGTRSGVVHKLGDVVDVRLVEAAPVAGALRFELLGERRASGRRTGPPRKRRVAPGRGKRR